MKRHIEYAKYVFKHKWYVMIACFSKGLIWRGLVHDLSKFLPSEWFPYANYFYEKNGTKKTIRDKTGYYKPTDTGNSDFDFAWVLHQKRNRHHWQWWVLPEDSGGVKILPMPYKYVVEMFCDWIGAGRAQGVDDWWNPKPWYEINKSKMQLHESTISILEEMMR
ncbi:MAG: DUF5662 family protein [Candidatus Nanoarchaeia archaeon]|nr:DUF5662 family protein [Candidatus Nanoarchaeia archaeon]